MDAGAGQAHDVERSRADEQGQRAVKPAADADDDVFAADVLHALDERHGLDHRDVLSVSRLGKERMRIDAAADVRRSFFDQAFDYAADLFRRDRVGKARVDLSVAVQRVDIDVRGAGCSGQGILFAFRQNGAGFTDDRFPAEDNIGGGFAKAAARRRIGAGKPLAEADDVLLSGSILMIAFCAGVDVDDELGTLCGHAGAGRNGGIHVFAEFCADGDALAVLYKFIRGGIKINVVGDDDL